MWKPNICIIYALILTLYAIIQLFRPKNNSIFVDFPYLVKLSGPIENILMNLWNETQINYFAKFLVQLQQLIINALPYYIHITENKTCDLKP